MKTVNCITINTDASFCPDTKAGGYAFTIVCDLFKIYKSGKFKNIVKGSTDAEMMCIANALSTLAAQKEVMQSKFLVINTDSKGSIKQIRHQETKLGRQVNILWGKCIQKMGSSNNEFRHVKAHSGQNYSRSKVNEWCDFEAKKWMKVMRSEIRRKTTS